MKRFDALDEVVGALSQRQFLCLAHHTRVGPGTEQLRADLRPHGGGAALSEEIDVPVAYTRLRTVTGFCADENEPLDPVAVLPGHLKRARPAHRRAHDHRRLLSHGLEHTRGPRRDRVSKLVERRAADRTGHQAQLAPPHPPVKRKRVEQDELHRANLATLAATHRGAP